MADRRDERREFLERLDAISIHLEQLAERLADISCPPASTRQDHNPAGKQQ